MFGRVVRANGWRAGVPEGLERGPRDAWDSGTIVQAREGSRGLGKTRGRSGLIRAEGT